MVDVRLACHRRASPFLAVHPSTGEPVLMELQGELANAPGPASSSHSTSQRTLGTLSFEHVSGIADVPVLCIGHHRLEGRWVTLKKPFAVIHRAKTSRSGLISTSSSSSAISSAAQSSTSSPAASTPASNPIIADPSQTTFRIDAIVRKKIVFKDRPLHLTTSEYRGISKFTKLK